MRLKKSKKIYLLIIFSILFGCKKTATPIKKLEIKQNKELLALDRNSVFSTGDEFINIICSTAMDNDDFYNLSCDDFMMSNSIIKSDAQNQVEFINIKFKDIDKAIIRNIKTSELLTSGPTVFKKNNTYVFLFPLIGEYNFGWLLYYYKENKLYFLGKRICYWNNEYEETKTSYKDFTKIYEKDEMIIVEMDSKNIIVKDKDYLNYPNYDDGKLFEFKEKYQFRFDLKNINFFKKYDNGDYEGDYNKMINNNIITPIE
jgi:hypothetical protein